MLHTPGTYHTCPQAHLIHARRFRCDNVWYDTQYIWYMTLFLFSAKNGGFDLRAGRVLPTETTRASNPNENVETGCMASWILLASWMNPVGCKANTLFTATTTAVWIDRGLTAIGEIFRGFLCRKKRFSSEHVSWLRPGTNEEILSENIIWKNNRRAELKSKWVSLGKLQKLARKIPIPPFSFF